MLFNYIRRNFGRFLQNIGASAGVFSTLGVLVLIAAIYFIMLALRRRRARQLDREMDEVSFVPESLRYFADGGDDTRYLSASPDLSAQSHGGERPVRPPQPVYGYGASRERLESDASAGVAGIGALRALRMAERANSQIVQPPRVQVYASVGALAKVSSMSAPVQFGVASPPPQLLQKGYMSHYVSVASPSPAESAGIGSGYGRSVVHSPPATARSTSHIPLSALPNPFDSGEGEPKADVERPRVLKVANE
ncbi:hypothetical protein B0H10DRAFT_1327518 [Mycena sp. CBHHK59/15]|nr:hypothetical protein B0H10DRAFT_1327518 [Mycena sp. CBHHK59/15]